MPDGIDEKVRDRSGRGSGYPRPVAAPKRYGVPSESDLEAYLFDFGLDRRAHDELASA